MRKYCANLQNIVMEESHASTMCAIVCRVFKTAVRLLTKHCDVTFYP